MGGKLIRGRGGFTLVEALVAVTVGTVVVILAATLFVAQSGAYTHVLERARTQDDARSVVERVAEDVRAVPSGGVLVADSARLVVRSPLSVGAVCDRFFWLHALHLPGGTDAFDTDDVSGVAILGEDGSWSFADRTWASVYAGGWLAPTLCAGEGADTTGATDDFRLFGDLEGILGVSTTVGDVVMFYRTLELRFAESALDPDSWALYRGTRGGTLVEFATGLDPSAHFSYRRGDTTHVASVTGA
ncbi:MAG: prepilin-type N-terminal cleavage/methylation domain-containing protein, partial [Gemmatimonadota bacterium]